MDQLASRIRVLDRALLPISPEMVEKKYTDLAYSIPKESKLLVPTDSIAAKTASFFNSGDKRRGFLESNKKLQSFILQR